MQTVALVLLEGGQQVLVISCYLGRLTHRDALAVLESCRALVKDGSAKAGQSVDLRPGWYLINPIA